MKSQLLFITITGTLYRGLLKPLLFLLDPEFVHVSMVRFGEICAVVPGFKKCVRWLYVRPLPELSQKINGTTFEFPIGLAAGFDYEGRLTQALSPLGFGFQTVGTITNEPWHGNAKPRLGRLPHSKSLMVNKGFKNPGANTIISQLEKKSFDIPVGISVGDAKGSIDEIIAAFKKFEASSIRNTYYELNISCPNLHGAMSFYIPKNLEDLLTKVDALKIKKPIWIKMPINLSDKETLSLLRVISKHSPAAVIFGNLQHDRKNKSFDAAEVQKFSVGNFSGKPTFSRSNELIALASKHFKKRFLIVGCGGVFTAEDAYTKIKLGAHLVQMITGLVFRGPQAVAEINFGLRELLHADGHTNIKDAVGTHSQPNK
jgi:dihydroorotate dehydrogenase